MIAIDGQGFKKLQQLMGKRSILLRQYLETALKISLQEVVRVAKSDKHWAKLDANPLPRAETLTAKKKKRLSVAKLSRLYFAPLPPPGPLRALTGNLRNSIKSRIVAQEGSSYIGIVGSNVIYLPPHEFGSKDGKTPPRPVLHPTFEETKAFVKRQFGDAVYRAVIEVF